MPIKSKTKIILTLSTAVLALVCGGLALPATAQSVATQKNQLAYEHSIGDREALQVRTAERQKWLAANRGHHLRPSVADQKRELAHEKYVGDLAAIRVRKADRQKWLAKIKHH